MKIRQIFFNFATMLLQLFGFLHFTWIDFLDILVVAAVIYFIFRWIKGSTAMNIFIAIISIVILRVIADAAGMKMITTLLDAVLDVGAIALIVIFQPEIRRGLNRVGTRWSFIRKLVVRRGDDSLEAKATAEIAQACFHMSKQQTGALIVLLHTDSLEDVIATGDRIDANISERLIRNIFFKNSPLHDGAMIIGDGRIIAARCTLPISTRQDLPANLGMRHKAAFGISEQSDADVIVVSEQTGAVSFIREGELTEIESLNLLKLKLGEGSKEQ